MTSGILGHMVGELAVPCTDREGVRKGRLGREAWSSVPHSGGGNGPAGTWARGSGHPDAGCTEAQFYS